MFRAATSCKTLTASWWLLLGHSAITSAHLGGDASSVTADAQSVHASERSTALLSYDVHEFQSSAGLTVREYVARTGTVFALSWSGAVAPDLHQLLGQHFANYAAAIAALSHPGLHRSVHVATDQLVVQLMGRPRSYSGRAYLPAQLPADFDVFLLR